MNKDNCLKTIWLVKVIVGLVAIMLVLVVHDRYVFHAQIYRNAQTEVNVFNKTNTSCPYICKCRYHIDSISQSKNVSSYVQIVNADSIYLTGNCNSCPNTLYIKSEDTPSLINLMKDVDGLISSNGLTFLISLIVALLIALVTDRIGAMEKFRSEMIIEREKGKEKLKKDLEEQIEKKNKEIENIIDKKTNDVIKQTRKKTADLYSHLADYDMLLARVESLFNLSITIGNVTTFMLSQDNDSTDKKNTLLEEIGTLCSRLSLLCDPIEDVFNGSEKRIDYLSEDEKNILLTYLADSKAELEQSRKKLKDNEHLYHILGDNKYMIENIYNMIEAVENLAD